MKKLPLTGLFAYVIIATWWLISTAGAHLVGTLPLFGNFRVLLVYCVASLPVCWCLSSRYFCRASVAKRMSLSAVGFVSVVIGLSLLHQPMQPDTAYLVRNVLRSICSVGLITPVAMLLSAMHNDRSVHTQFLQQLSLSLICVAILPALYVHNQVVIFRNTLTLQSGRGHIVRELGSLAQYMELHGDDLMGQRRLSAELKDLRRNYREVLVQVARPLDESLRPDVHRRAMQLLSIDQAGSADRLLVGLVPDSETLLLRALANRELKRWDVVEQVTRQLIAATPLDQLSNELLGESLHQQRKYTEAVCVYETLLHSGEHNRLATASLHIRLAKLFMDQGDHAGAARHLERARTLSPERSVETQTHRKALLQQGCSLRPS